jgi:hypothetical protein
MTTIAVDEALEVALARDHDAASSGADAIRCVAEPALIPRPDVKRLDQMGRGQNQLTYRPGSKHHVWTGAPWFSARLLAL